MFRTVGRGARCRGLTAVVTGATLALTSACGTVVESSIPAGRSVESSREVRYPLKRGAPVLGSEWSVEGERAIGKLDIATCQHDLTSTVVEVEKRDDTGQQVLGALAMISALSLGIASVIVLSQDPKTTCTSGFGSANSNIYYEERCETVQQGRAEGAALMISSGALAAVGWYLFYAAAKPVENRYEQSSSKRGPCLTRDDLGTLELALRVRRGELVPAKVSLRGSARIQLANVADLPRDEDLPIVVVSVPAGARHLLKRGQVVGRLRVPSEGMVPASPTEAPAPPPSDVPFPVDDGAGAPPKTTNSR